MKLITILFSAFLLIFPIQSHADVTKQELRNRSDSHTTWTVEKPIEDVFAAYKEYSDVHFAPSGFLWAKGGITEAELKGDSAEITMRLQSNPFSQGVWFLIELKRSGNSTVVNYWWRNSRWRKEGERLKALLPIAAP